MTNISMKKINGDYAAANALISERSNEITDELIRANSCGVNDYTLAKVIALSSCALICLAAMIVGIVTFNTASYTTTGISIAIISISFYGFVRFMGGDFIEASKLVDFRKYKEAVELRDKLKTQTTTDIAEAFKNSVDENGNFQIYDLGYDFGTSTHDCLNELRYIRDYERYTMRFDFIYWVCSIFLTVGAVLVTSDIVYNTFQAGLAKDLSLVFVLVAVSIISIIGYAVANYFAAKCESSFPTAMLAGDVGISALSGVALYLVVGIIFVILQILAYIACALLLFSFLAAIFTSN
jgi:hypothetical protein